MNCWPVRRETVLESGEERTVCMIAEWRAAGEDPDRKVRTENRADQRCSDQADLPNLASLDSSVGGL